MSEKKLSQQHEQSVDQRELDKTAEEVGERIREQHEQIEKKSPETGPSEKEAQLDALEQAKSVEKSQEKPADAPEKTPEKRVRGKRSKQELDASYKEIMHDTRSQMPAANRAFSKVIHNRVVETSSQAVGSTIARPNAILAGSISAFIVTLSVYLIARHYGYPLSGSETLVAFAGGWLAGIVFDFLRVMITGKR